MSAPANFNGHLLTQLPDAFDSAQRALFYADALFETMRVFDEEIPLLKQHWARLSTGLTALGFSTPHHWDADFFRQEIHRVAPTNARVRLTVWRSPGGRYAPIDNAPQFLITAEPLGNTRLQPQVPGLELGLSISVRLPVDTFSNLKTLNAARYVAAAREARSNGWDDALLLNAYGRVCEATASNVFWWEGEQLCTVPLTEGCVAGVFRAALLDIARSRGIHFVEKTALPEDLMAADEIFLTNAVRGIQPVRIFAGRSRTSVRTIRLFDHIQHAVFGQ